MTEIITLQQITRTNKTLQRGIPNTPREMSDLIRRIDEVSKKPA